MENKLLWTAFDNERERIFKLLKSNLYDPKNIYLYVISVLVFFL